MIRLDKFLSENTVLTRSQIKEACKKGLVFVNGVKEKASDRKIDENTDVIVYDGQEIGKASGYYILLNKPAGYLSAVSDEKEKTVLDLIPSQYHRNLHPVGRLDKDTTGLLLLTNDGDLTHRITGPKYHVEKEYIAHITGILTKEQIRNLEVGTDIGDDSPCLPAKVEVQAVYESFAYSEEDLRGLPKEYEENTPASVVSLTITEGRYHQVKRMFHANRHEVFRLERVRVGDIILEKELKQGEFRFLTEEEIQSLGQ